MKTIIIFALLVAGTSALPARHIKVLGNIFGSVLNKRWEHFRQIGNQWAVSVANPIKESKVTFTFPEDPVKSNHIIRGIKSIDHNIKNPAKIEIENGGIGAKQVTLTVTAPKGTGMGTEFYFYGEEVANGHPEENRLKQQLTNENVYFEVKVPEEKRKNVEKNK